MKIRGHINWTPKHWYFGFALSFGSAQYDTPIMYADLGLGPVSAYLRAW